MDLTKLVDEQQQEEKTKEKGNQQGKHSPQHGKKLFPAAPAALLCCCAEVTSGDEVRKLVDTANPVHVSLNGRTLHMVVNDEAVWVRLRKERKAYRCVSPLCCGGSLGTAPYRLVVQGPKEVVLKLRHEFRPEIWRTKQVGSFVKALLVFTDEQELKQAGEALKSCQTSLRVWSSLPEFTKCLGCHKFGHVVAGCPTTLCRRCNASGHSAAQCPTRQYRLVILLKKQKLATIVEMLQLRSHTFWVHTGSARFQLFPSRRLVVESKNAEQFKEAVSGAIRIFGDNIVSIVPAPLPDRRIDHERNRRRKNEERPQWIRKVLVSSSVPLHESPRVRSAPPSSSPSATTAPQKTDALASDVTIAAKAGTAFQVVVPRKKTRKIKRKKPPTGNQKEIAISESKIDQPTAQAQVQRRRRSLTPPRPTPNQQCEEEKKLEPDGAAGSFLCERQPLSNNQDSQAPTISISHPSTPRARRGGLLFLSPTLPTEAAPLLLDNQQ